MSRAERTAVLIPARFKSTRYPGKPLVPLLGKPMVIWVAELSALAVGKDNVFIATESQKIAAVVEEHGYQSIMTSERALTGTDRIAEAAQMIDADIIVNVQGDEPLLNPDDILNIAAFKRENMDAVINGYCWIGDEEDPESVNIPKVITNEQDWLVYMSRKPLPGFKDQNNAPAKYKKQVCIYAFTKADLQAFGVFGRKSYLEGYEDIEILRFLELGIPVRMVETNPGSLAVDVPDDVIAVEEALSRQPTNNK